MYFQFAAVARASTERPYGQASAQAPLGLEVEFRRERDCCNIVCPRRRLGERSVKQSLQ
jgi:hypothetical protein